MWGCVRRRRREEGDATRGCLYLRDGRGREERKGKAACKQTRERGEERNVKRGRIAEEECRYMDQKEKKSEGEKRMREVR